MVDKPFSHLGQEFTAEVYRAVSIERLEVLPGLYRDGEYTLAIYLAGLAVEAMFRAYRMKVDTQFDSRHDLFELAKAAKFAGHVPPKLRDRYSQSLLIVARRWSSTHRYRSDSAMRSFLKRTQFDRDISGDFLKENARRVIASATDLVTMGTTLWKT